MHPCWESLRRRVAEFPFAHEFLCGGGRLFEGGLLRQVELQREALWFRTAVAFELTEGGYPSPGALLELVQHGAFYTLRAERKAAFADDEPVGIGYVVDRHAERVCCRR